MSKRPEITEMTKANLVTAFWDILEKKENKKITVKEITDHAGYYRSTFYEYFTDISDLLEQVEDSLIEDIKKQAVNSLTSSSIDDLILKSADFYNNNSKYLLILIGSSKSSGFESKLKDTLRPLILNYYKFEKDDIEAEYLIEFALSALIGTLTYWFQRNKNITVQELVSIINPVIKNIISSNGTISKG